MSHITGTLQVLSPPMTIGPGTTSFNPPAAPGGTKLLMLHFTNLNFKPGDQLQVQLGYRVDTFTAADGPAFWTRPINVYVFPGGVQITYVKGGGAKGSVDLDMFGRGERHDAVPSAFHHGNSNCDPFYIDPAYVEPDYVTDKDGNRPSPYSPRFYKVKEVLFHHHDGVGDFSILRLAEPVVGVPIIQLRHDLPGIGEQVFGIHHPNGAVKKLSPPVGEGFSTVKSSGPGGITVPSGFHVSGGSSGSGLFDMAGRICGGLSDGDPCCGFSCSDLFFFPTKTIV